MSVRRRNKRLSVLMRTPRPHKQSSDLIYNLKVKFQNTAQSEEVGGSVLISIVCWYWSRIILVLTVMPVSFIAYSTFKEQKSSQSAS